MLNVLINAYAVSPTWGSEPGMGWNWVTNLAKYCNLHIITEGEWKEEIEVAMNNLENADRLHFHYINVSPEIREMCWNQGTWKFYQYYREWEHKALDLAKEIIGHENINIVHKLNMIGYREPGYLWKLEVPFVWGPVGGAPNEPLAFMSLFSWTGRVRVLFRYILNECQKRVNVRARRSARAARRIWAVTDADERMIVDVWGEACQRLVEAGTDGALITNPIHRCQGEILRMVWSGTHTPRKALPILLHALATLREHGYRDGVRVDILGDGVETKSWQKLAVQLRVSDCLRWHGKLSRDEALRLMAKSHVLACPSIKEASSIVVIEAISMGLPIVCHDACGMGLIVTNECGIKIPLKDPKTSVMGFAGAIRRLIDSPELISCLSAGCLLRAKELTWTEKARVIAKGYEEVV